MATFARGVPVAERVLKVRAERAIPKPQPEQTWSSKLPGDPLALRGIPAIGMGVQGAIMGTRP